MCGRYTLTVDIDEVSDRFGCLKVVPDYRPRYNAAPTDVMPVIVNNRGENRMEMMTWGLVPFWAKDSSIGSRLINARVETIQEKPAFKYSLKNKRCIIPADGYYEWQKNGRNKQPMRVILHSREIFGLAGLWDEWKRPDGEYLRTFTILTAEPAPAVAQIHNRMPFILQREQEDLWLYGSCDETFLSQFKPLDRLEAYQVSSLVNSPKNDRLECIRPVNI